MKIFIRTILWAWATAASLYVVLAMDAPWWVSTGAGLGGGAALAWLSEAIRTARAPKPVRKGYPTTPR